MFDKKKMEVNKSNVFVYYIIVGVQIYLCLS